MSKKVNVKFKKADRERLKKYVAQFNKKVDKLSKDPKYKYSVPEKLHLRSYRDNYGELQPGLNKLLYDKEALNYEISSIKKFLRKDAEKLVKVPETENLYATKWQIEYMKERTPGINKRRQERLEEIESYDILARQGTQSYKRGDVGMGDASKLNLRPLTTFYPSMDRTSLNLKFRTIQKESQKDYLDKRDYQLRKNYVDTLLKEFGALGEDMKTVAWHIRRMDIKDFLKTFYQAPKEFEFAYPDKEQLEIAVKRMKEIWLGDK